jgi:hypothetical protein
MKYEVRILGLVECSSDADAKEKAKKLQALLGQPIVKMTLKSQGVDLLQATVGEPKRQA